MLAFFQSLLYGENGLRDVHMYLVQEGDTVAGIAARHGMTEEELKALNELATDEVLPDQELKVYRRVRSQSLPILRHEENERSIGGYEAEVMPIREEYEPTETEPDMFDVNLKAKVPTQMTQQSSHCKQRSRSERVLPQYEREDEANKTEPPFPNLLGTVDNQEILADTNLSQTLVPKLEFMLPYRYHGYDWEVLYSLRQHGCSLQSLMRKVRGRSPTLVIIETTQKDVFGGFVVGPWHSSGAYYGNGECFVFTCKPRFECFTWKQTNTMCMLSNKKCIAMGGGGGFAWILNSDLSRGSTSKSTTFGNRPLAQAEDFDVLSVEVWGFVMKD